MLSAKRKLARLNAKYMVLRDAADLLYRMNTNRTIQFSIYGNRFTDETTKEEFRREMDKLAFSLGRKADKLFRELMEIGPN